MQAQPAKQKVGDSLDLPMNDVGQSKDDLLRWFLYVVTCYIYFVLT